MFSRRHPVRVLYFLVLLFLMGVVAVFAVQNRGLITLQFLDRSIACPASLLIVLVYLLGMVSGGTVLGIMRRSFQQAVARPSQG
jgi:uncharacterized integral membrane protein